MRSVQNCSSIKRRGDEACSIHFGAVYLTCLIQLLSNWELYFWKCTEEFKGISACRDYVTVVGQLLLEDDQIVYMGFKNKNIDWPVWQVLWQVKLSNEKSPNSDWASGCTSETVCRSVFNGRLLPLEEFSKVALNPGLSSCLLDIWKYQRLRCLIWCFSIFFVVLRQ